MANERNQNRESQNDSGFGREQQVQQGSDQNPTQPGSNWDQSDRPGRFEQHDRDQGQSRQANFGQGRAPWGQQGGYDHHNDHSGRGSAMGGQTGYGQNNYGQSQQGGHYHDHSYSQWRQRQMEQFDNDYHEFRQTQQDEFNSKFDEWRKQRGSEGQPGSTGATSPTAGKSGSSSS